MAQSFSSSHSRSRSSSKIHDFFSSDYEHKYLCLAFLLLGIGHLIPWMAIIAAVDYWAYIYEDDSQLRKGTIEFSLSVVYHTAIFLSMAASTLYVIYTRQQLVVQSKHQLKYSVSVISICLSIMLLCIVMIVVLCHLYWHWLLLVLTTIIALAEGILRCEIYSMTSKIRSTDYTTALMLGHCVAGLLTCTLRIVTKSLFRHMRHSYVVIGGKSDTEVWYSVILYFALAVVILSTCIGVIQIIGKSKHLQRDLNLHDIDDNRSFDDDDKSNTKRKMKQHSISDRTMILMPATSDSESHNDGDVDEESYTDDNSMSGTTGSTKNKNNNSSGIHEKQPLVSSNSGRNNRSSTSNGTTKYNSIDRVTEGNDTSGKALKVDVDEDNEDYDQNSEFADVTMYELLSMMFYPALCICISFFTTMTVFPGLFTSLPSIHHETSTGWFALSLITLFNASDFVGRMALFHPGAAIRSKQLLTYIILLRAVLLIPLIVLHAIAKHHYVTSRAYAHGEGHVWYAGDAVSYIMVGLFGITNGYCGTTALVLGAIDVREQLEDRIHQRVANNHNRLTEDSNKLSYHSSDGDDRSGKQNGRKSATDTHSRPTLSRPQFGRPSTPPSTARKTAPPNNNTYSIGYALTLVGRIMALSLVTGTVFGSWVGVLISYTI